MTLGRSVDSYGLSFIGRAQKRLTRKRSATRLRRAAPSSATLNAHLKTSTDFQASQWLVTVLISSIDWVGFDCAVKDDQEFSHRGGEGKFGWFAGGAQSLVKSAQDWVVSSGD